VKNNIGTNEKVPASRQKLLRAAEHLIVTEGLYAITTRRLAAAARVNTSMVVYNFGSLDALIEEVFKVNFQDMKALESAFIDELKERDLLTLENVIAAIIRPIRKRPVFCQHGTGAQIVQEVFAYASPELRHRATLQLKEGFEPLAELLAPLVPHLGHKALIWRLCCITSAAMSMTPNTSSWELVTEFFGAPDEDEALQQLINFSIASLRA
jgi:AcrR family transcriptional regulator